MEDDYNTTIGHLKAALSCGPTISPEKQALLDWLNSLGTPPNDDDVVVVKHPK